MLWRPQRSTHGQQSLWPVDGMHPLRTQAQVHPDGNGAGSDHKDSPADECDGGHCSPQAGGLAVGRDSIFHNEGSDRSGGSRKDDVEEERAKVQGQGFHTAAHMVEAPDDDEGFEKVADAPEKRKKEEEKASS